MTSVVIGGGTGFVGRALAHTLERNGYNVFIVTRGPPPSTSRKPDRYWRWEDLEQRGIPEQCAAVVNLAGANIMDQAWTEEYRKKMRDSRIDTTRNLSSLIARTPPDRRPSAFITSSAIGYYPPSLTENYDESSSPDPDDYLSKLCIDWEAAAELPEDTASTVRQIIVRIGLVLGRDGGLIGQSFMPFYMGVGGQLGLAGSQWMSWIHIDDLCALYLHLIRGNDRGVFNGTAPLPCTSHQFARSFGRALWRPTWVTPAFMLQKMFGPDRAKLMLEGQRVFPHRILRDTDFSYKYANIEAACKEFARLELTKEEKERRSL